MNVRILALVSTLSAAGLLAGCGGGASGSLNPPTQNGGGSTQSTQSQVEDSINTANSVGSPMKDYNSYNSSMNSPAQLSIRSNDAQPLVANGSCNNGVEFFSPDRNGDPNSTERIVFYDNACTAMATDAVRIFTSNGANSESVQRTVTSYAMNSASPEAVRSETILFTNAQFDKYGYPIVADGFDRTHSGELDINGVKTIDGDGELVVAASSTNVLNFCADSAGFNATGNASLNETFGWAGITPSGTRTVNSNGSITWSATRNGTAYTAPIGDLSIDVGVQNTSCPISTPMFTLAGGTVKGTYTLPINATYTNGILSNLTISNAVLVNGDSLNVQTNSGVQPGNIHFISGTLTNGSAVLVSTFNVNAFGDGVLTMASGQQYTIVDWHVVK